LSKLTISSVSLTSNHVIRFPTPINTLKNLQQLKLDMWTNFFDLI
jgi:hypothetical protein